MEWNYAITFHAGFFLCCSTMSTPKNKLAEAPEALTVSTIEHMRVTASAAL